MIVKNVLKLVLCCVISVLLVGLMQPFVFSASTDNTYYCRNCHETETVQLWGGTAHDDTDCTACRVVEFINETNHNTTPIPCTSCHNITIEHSHSALAENICLPCHSRGNYTFNSTYKIIAPYVADFSK